MASPRARSNFYPRCNGAEAHRNAWHLESIFNSGKFLESMRYAQLIMGPAGSGKVGKLIYWTFGLQIPLKTMHVKIARL